MPRPAGARRPARTPSTIGNWIHAIIRTLDARGFRGIDVAREAGISPRTLSDPFERVPQPSPKQRAGRLEPGPPW